MAFVCVQLDIGLEIFQLILGQKVCHYLGCDKVGRGVKANSDKGGGEVQNMGFYSDILFEWPQGLIGLICDLALISRDSPVVQTPGKYANRSYPEHLEFEHPEL